MGKQAKKDTSKDKTSKNPRGINKPSTAPKKEVDVEEGYKRIMKQLKGKGKEKPEPIDQVLGPLKVPQPATEQEPTPPPKAKKSRKRKTTPPTAPVTKPVATILNQPINPKLLSKDEKKKFKKKRGKNHNRTGNKKKPVPSYVTEGS